jgi:methylenetetrahydrofolate dehydrogenase (NADP+)/methenyltetrahydrofolate cyclohydrolase
MHILHELHINLAGKNIVIIGTGMLVGKPLAIMMMNEEASVMTCNSQTKDIKEKCLQADIIVTGVGKKNILRGDMVKPGTIVIDTGISFEDKKIYGDANFAEVAPLASYITPTPGGVGPVTVAHLLWNTVLCAKNSNLKI